MAKTVKELRAEAKALGIKGYSRLRKADLFKAIAAKTESLPYDASANSAQSYNVAISKLRDKLQSFRKEVIGDCTLYLGDCREILPLLPAVDSVITDPPYGIDLQPQRGLTKAIAGDGQSEAKALWAEVARLAYGLAKADTAHLFWTGWSETWTKDALAAHFKVKSCVVWGKNVWGIGYYTRPQHEFAWYCHKGQPPVLSEPDSDLWMVPRIQAPEHSCEKPVALLQRAVRLCTKPNGLVLDPFMGIGATGVACAKMGRKFIGIELDPGYFDTTCRRIEAAYKQPDMFVPAPSKTLEQLSLIAAE
jgi:site-specific DNA-methyltransferase (adenine-specific)